MFNRNKRKKGSPSFEGIGYFPKIRSDITPIEETGDEGLVFYDPVSDKVYEFGKQERKLLELFDGAKSPIEICNEYSEKFDIELELSDLESFLETLFQWNLLESTNDGLTSKQHTTNSETQDKPDNSEPQTPVVYRHSDQLSLTTDARLDREEISDPKLRAATLASNYWHFFDPSGFLSGLGDRVAWVRHFVFLIPVLLLTGLIAITQNFELLQNDVARILRSLSLLQHLIFSLVTVNLLTQLGMGTTCRYCGGDTPSFGLIFIFRLVPRFAVLLDGVDQLPRSRQLWIHASPLLLRIFSFSVGIMFWLMTRNQGTLLPQIFLSIAIVSTISFFLTAHPFMKVAGYKVLCAWIEEPRLRQKAMVALFSIFSLRAKAVITKENLFYLKVFAISSLLYILVFFGVIGYTAARWLRFNFHGTGVFLFLVVVAYLFYSIRKSIKQRRQTKHSRVERYATTRTTVTKVAQGKQAKTQTPKKKKSRILKWFIRLSVIGIFAYVCLLPYPYKTGGSAEVKSVDFYDIHSEIEGVIKELYFDTGQWVSAGTLIAKMSSLEEERNVATTKAEIQAQEARLQQLLTTPTPAELTAALQRWETAKVQAEYSRSTAKRTKQLFESGHVSVEDHQDAEKKRQVDEAQVLEKKADLDKVTNAVHPQEIEEAKAVLASLKEKLEYSEAQFKNSEIGMPIDGRILTEDFRNHIGKYFDKGDMLLRVADDRQIRLEIDVPESDIGEIGTGKKSHLKVWSYPDRTFEGEVVEISPVVTDETYGKVVNVVSKIPNPEGDLKIGMTGYAKIDAGTKPVIVAFTRMFVRFFLIEVWSWVP